MGVLRPEQALTPEPLRVLIVEDSADDAELLIHELQRGSRGDSQPSRAGLWSGEACWRLGGRITAVRLTESPFIAPIVSYRQPSA